MLRNRYVIVGIEILLEIAYDDVFGQSGGSIRIGALDVVEGPNGRQPDLGMARRQFEHHAFQPRQALPIVPCVFALERRMAQALRAGDLESSPKGEGTPQYTSPVTLR